MDRNWEEAYKIGGVSVRRIEYTKTITFTCNMLDKITYPTFQAQARDLA